MKVTFISILLLFVLDFTFLASGASWSMIDCMSTTNASFGTMCLDRQVLVFVGERPKISNFHTYQVVLDERLMKGLKHVTKYIENFFYLRALTLSTFSQVFFYCIQVVFYCVHMFSLFCPGVFIVSRCFFYCVQVFFVQVVELSDSERSLDSSSRMPSRSTTLNNILFRSRILLRR